MGRKWQVVAVIGLIGMVGCGPADEPAEVVEGGEGVTVETGPPLPGAAAADGAPAELPPEIDVIPSNE